MEVNTKKSPSSLANALRLLNLFHMDEPELTLSELAEKMGVGPSTTHRITTTLMHEGYLARDPITKKFRLGSSILAVEKTILSNYDICRFSPPILEKLVRDTGEAAHLSILRNHKVVYLQQYESPNYVQLFSHIGNQNPIHPTSTGQSILAFQSASEIEKVVAHGLCAYTPNTITNPQTFRELLVRIRKQGYAYSREELHQGIASIAVPVKASSGKVVYAVSIVGPSSRINPHRLTTLTKAVKEAAEELARRNTK